MRRKNLVDPPIRYPRSAWQNQRPVPMRYNHPTRSYSRSKLKKLKICHFWHQKLSFSIWRSYGKAKRQQDFVLIFWFGGHMQIFSEIVRLEFEIVTKSAVFTITVGPCCADYWTRPGALPRGVIARVMDRALVTPLRYWRRKARARAPTVRRERGPIGIAARSSSHSLRSAALRSDWVRWPMEEHWGNFQILLQ